MDQQEKAKTPSGNKHQELPLQYNINDQPISVNLGQVVNLFGDIEKYNGQFSMGSMMARMIFSHFEKDEVIENELPTNLTDEEGNQQVNAFFLASSYKDLLNNIGLSLEPVSGKKASIHGEEGSAGEGEMRINISSQENFTSFLSALKPERMEIPGLKNYLEKLPAILSVQVLDHYNLVFPEKETVQLFTGLEKIITEYKRLGMGESVIGLERYLEHGKIGDLREFVAIERRHLYSESGQWGPADWQKDSSPAYLESEWNEAIAILEMARANPKAQALFKKLISHLMRCVNIALENNETLNYNSPSFPEMKRQNQTILEVAKQKLDLISTSETP